MMDDPTRFDDGLSGRRVFVFLALWFFLLALQALAWLL